MISDSDSVESELERYRHRMAAFSDLALRPLSIAVIAAVSSPANGRIDIANASGAILHLG
jgi:hypothetical protein